MAQGHRAKYLTKTVKFAGQNLILYSLDGLTWSTKRAELQAIKERQESQRAILMDVKDEEEPQSKEAEECSAGDEDVQMCAAPDDDEEQEKRPKKALDKNRHLGSKTAPKGQSKPAGGSKPVKEARAKTVALRGRGASKTLPANRRSPQRVGRTSIRGKGASRSAVKISGAAVRSLKAKKKAA